MADLRVHAERGFLTLGPINVASCFFWPRIGHLETDQNQVPLRQKTLAAPYMNVKQASEFKSKFE